MSERAYRLSLLAVMALACLVALQQRFMLDDAFIALRYARNWVEGAGLVWNAGERVQGFTSPLWTVLLALPLRAGVEPIVFIDSVGPLLLLGTLAGTAALARRVFDSRAAALLATALAACNPSLLAFATGGLETQLLACLLTALFVLAAPALPLTVARGVGLSLLSAACLLTRLDAALAVLAAWLLVLLRERRRPRAARAQLQLMAALKLPALALVGGWLAFCFEYYGDVLPNTFYAKTGGSAWLSGAGFLVVFMTSYVLWPSVLGLLLAWPRVRRRAPAAYALALALGASYAYIASVGGDFMEFRFCVPTLPLLFTLIAGMIVRAVARPWLRAALVASVLGGAAHHALTFQSQDGIESVSALASHLDERAQNWIGVGRALASSLPPNSTVTIALTAAGAIPYYSRLPAVDMLGLTDPWIARHGITLAGERGHHRLAPLSYLVARGVNLVLGHPMLEEPSAPNARAYELGILTSRPFFAHMGLAALPPTAALVEIPVERSVVLSLLLRSHPDIEQAIRAHGWRRFALIH
jgi:hypothetical protein